MKVRLVSFVLCGSLNTVYSENCDVTKREEAAAGRRFGNFIHELERRGLVTLIDSSSREVKRHFSVIFPDDETYEDGLIYIKDYQPYYTGRYRHLRFSPCDVLVGVFPPAGWIITEDGRYNRAA